MMIFYRLLHEKLGTLNRCTFLLTHLLVWAEKVRKNRLSEISKDEVASAAVFVSV